MEMTGNLPQKLDLTMEERWIFDFLRSLKAKMIRIKAGYTRAERNVAQVALPMEKHYPIAFLFDLDGVIIDTESQYDIFWKKTAETYQLGIENFEKVIKGTILSHILSKYFSCFPEHSRQEITTGIQAFELEMDIVPIPGALAFLETVKKAGIPTGLVTSSCDRKIDYVFSRLPIRQYFDVIVSADRITRGKPDPMCYLLAAQDLDVSPSNCHVFEDSFNGIRAGNAAGMKVTGLATTHSAESIAGDCLQVIPDFRDCSEWFTSYIA